MKLNDVFPLVYCINLDERPDRMEKAQEELDKRKISFIRYSAIKNENPVVGCQASHTNILINAWNARKDVFIFEDDIEFIGDTFDISYALEDLKKNIGWFMFYLGGNIMRPAYQVDKHLARLSNCQSTHAYGVKWETIPGILSVIRRYPEAPLDLIYSDVIVPNYPCYISIPMIAIQGTSYSDIEKQEMTYQVPIDRYNQHLIKNKHIKDI